MGLSARLTAGMVALASLTAAAVGMLTYRNAAAVIIPRALDRLDTHARLLAAGLEASVRNMRVDPLALPWTVDGIVRSTLAGGADPTFAGMTVRRWHDGLGVRLTAELNAKPAYYQARFIGIADGGREIVRVDRSGPGGAIRVVPDAELQQKATATTSSAPSGCTLAKSTYRRSG
jgi:hypothetical protein